MRRFDPRALTALTVALCACVVHLDDDTSVEPRAAVASGCVPFADAVGDLRSLASPAGLFFVAERAGGVDAAALLVSRPARGDCAWDAVPLGPVVASSPLRADAIAAPLDPVTTDRGSALYYALYVPDAAAPLGLRSLGVGVAPYDGGARRFAPTAELLWSPDRPPYGASALRVGDLVYAIGCVATGPFASDCFVARAPASAVASAAAYTYFDGAAWSPNADSAAAIVRDVGAANVRFDVARARFVMTYVPPLGSTIVARTAPAPEGPWSSPKTVASCALPSVDGVFCGGAQQHALDGVPAGSIAITYAARAFAMLPPAAAAPHLVVAAVP